MNLKVNMERKGEESLTLKVTGEKMLVDIIEENLIRMFKIWQEACVEAGGEVIENKKEGG